MNTNNKPFFTIGIPTFNRANYLKLAIESVLKQDFNDYEILIIDNRSTDNTKTVVRSYCSQHRNIRYIRNAVNNGGVMSFVNIFRRARGTYLFFLCDDDIILKSDTLSGLYKIIQNKKPGFIKMENLFYYKMINNIMKCHKFKTKNTIIKPRDRCFITKTFNTYLEFWSGSIYKLEPKLFHLLNTKEWLYTSLDYIYAQTQKYGAIFTGDYNILGRYTENYDMTNLIEPVFSLDTYLDTIKKWHNTQ